MSTEIKMKKRTVTIRLRQLHKLGGQAGTLTIKGELSALETVTDHDIAAMLFAAEFAINNHSEIPLRSHIFMEPYEPQINS